jgi:hypothetical protein
MGIFLEQEPLVAALPPSAAGYEQDYVCWLTEQVRLLRERCFVQLDLENLIEELEGQVRAEKNALRNRLRVLLAHLLKFHFQAQKKSASWVETIVEQREQIDSLLEKSPSLKRAVEEMMDWAYPRAVRKASKETGMPAAAFPSILPYTTAQVLDHDFYPELA